MKKVKASLGILGITVLAAAGMVLSVSARSGLPAERTAKVEICRVEMGDVEQVLAVNGVLRYETEYAAISPVTGIVAQVYVRPGQSVAEGQPLFRLNGEMQAMTVSAALAGSESVTDILPLELSGMQLQEAAAQMESLTVRAAADGLVQQVSISQNSGVVAGTPAVALSGQEQEIHCSVVLRDAEKVKPGMRARLLKEEDLLCMADVKEIGPAQISSTTGQTVCLVSLTPDAPIRLPLGAALETEIILYGRENVPVLPLQAISEEGTVRWVADGRSYEIPAEVMMEDEVGCWVNLPEGTEVICGGENTVEGQRVKEMKP